MWYDIVQAQQKFGLYIVLQDKQRITDLNLQMMLSHETKHFKMQVFII